MDHIISEVAGLTVLALNGEVDLSTTPEVRQLILTQLGAKHDLAVDLSGVSYIDSSGVASLVEGYQKAKADGLRFGLVQVSESAMKVLQLARLDKVFNIYADASSMNQA